MPTSAPPHPSGENRPWRSVDQAMQRHDYRPDALIETLHAAQDAFGYLDGETLAYIAAKLRLPPAKVFGVATFYAHFTLQPKGKYVFRLCDGTACHVKRSHGILEALYRRLRLSAERNTTDDMLFTVETVSCLGACGLAPVMVVNEEVHGEVTPEKALAIVDRIFEKETRQ